MKGGGIVFLVIFFFLFICFVWGVASVVGNVRDAIKANRPNPTISQAPPISNAPIGSTASAQTSRQADMINALEQLQKIHELHKNGGLTDAEFSQIKTKLIQNMHLA